MKNRGITLILLSAFLFSCGERRTVSSSSGNVPSSESGSSSSEVPSSSKEKGNISQEALASFQKGLREIYSKQAVSFSGATLTSDDSGKELSSDSEQDEFFSNERHFVQTEKKEGKETRIEAQLAYDETNYFEFHRYPEGDSIAEGALLGEGPDIINNPDGYILSQKNYLTKEKAEEKIASFHGGYQLLDNCLSSFQKPTHLSGTLSQEDKDRFSASFFMDESKKEGGYLWQGSVLETLDGETQQAALDTLEMELDEERRPTKVSFLTTSYASARDLLEEDGSLSKKAKLAKKEKQEIAISYGERAKASSFAIPFESFVASRISVDSPVKLAPGGIYAPTIASATPSDAANLGDYQVVLYDSSFFKKQADGSLLALKSGTTSVKVGTLYNEVEATVEITIAMKAPTYIRANGGGYGSQSGSWNRSWNIEAGQTLSAYASVDDGADPRVKIETTGDISLASQDDEETTLKNDRCNFSLTAPAGKKGEGTFTITSLVNSKVSLTQKVTVSLPKAKGGTGENVGDEGATNATSVVGLFHSGVSTHDPTFRFKADNTATFTYFDDMEEKQVLHFSYGRSGSLLSLTSSEEVSYFSANIALWDDAPVKGLNLYQLSSISLIPTGGSESLTQSYQTYYQEFRPLALTSYASADGNIIASSLAVDEDFSNNYGLGYSAEGKIKLTYGDHYIIISFDLDRGTPFQCSILAYDQTATQFHSFFGATYSNLSEAGYTLIFPSDSSNDIGVFAGMSIDFVF